MFTTTLPITLILAGALALVNIWLSVRVGQVRRSEKVGMGDGGSDRVLRRMRAHANFAENAPIVLLLILLLEFAAGTSVWLWTAAGLFLIARVAHGLGMDEGKPGRSVGTGLTLALQLLLGLWAISVPITGAYSPAVKDVDVTTARG